MKKKLLLSLLLTSLLSSVTSCGDKNNQGNKRESSKDVNESVYESEIEYISVSQEEDVIGLIPEEVLNAQNISIDILEYIEGQNGTIKDLGAAKLSAEDVKNSEIAKYYAAAKEFKKLAPGVKINLIYCSIDEYETYRKSYNSQKGHLPHIFHSINEFQVDMQNGMIIDLSRYEDCEYYQAYNDYFLDLVNWGGFTACFPTHIAPFGMFVNKDILNECYVVDPSSNDGKDYEDFVDNLTFKNWVDSLSKTYVPGQHAGYGHYRDFLLSYIDPQIYRNYAENHTISLTHLGLEEELKLENEASKYGIFEYPIHGNLGKEEDGFSDVANWAMTQAFVDGKYAYNMQEPWNLNNISQKAQIANKDHNTFDYIPYPKLNEESEQMIGLRLGGLEIGNQCPIGGDGNKHCASETSSLEEDIAAYFSMFLVMDPRAIKAAAEIEYYDEGASSSTKGVLSLPLSERDYKFSWQSDEETLAKYPDPAENYTDNWEYQISLWLKTYNTWWENTDGEEPDVNYWSNVNYGFAKVMDILYNHPEQIVDVARVPENIADDELESRAILSAWEDRFLPTNEGNGLGTSTYVADILAITADIEKDINENAIVAYQFLQEMVDNYYGEGLYDIADL